MEVLSDVRIQNKDTIIIGKTDINGRFIVDIPKNTKTLIFYSLGYEPASIALNSDCDTLELVLMNDSRYDYISSRKIDKRRLKRFNKLPGLYSLAYKNGLFLKESVCYSREFQSEKPELDELYKRLIQQIKQNELYFKKLNIGDTIKIPFNGEYRYDGTNRTTLSFYSISANTKNYDCIIKGVVISKNKHLRGYNLVYKVTECDKCKSPSIFEGKLVKNGEIFTYNIKYFKILYDNY